MTVYRALWPAGRLAVRLAGGMMLALALATYVEAVHEARASRLRVCAAELATLRASTPFVARYLTPADPCLALAVVRGGQP